MLETLSPQEAMALFRNGCAFFVDVRTEKEFLKRAIPGCPLVPLDKLEREGGLNSRFSGKPIVFFCRSGSRTQNKADLLERSASGKAYQLGGGILAWEQAGFPVWSIRELLPCLHRNRLLSPGFLPDSCFYLNLAPSALLFPLERGAFLRLSSVEIAKKGWLCLTENRKCSQMPAGAESAACFMLLRFQRLP